MAAHSSTSGESENKSAEQTSARFKRLYPAVNEEETPLPKFWSPKDKYNFIGLSQNNLRVHYKGVGKNHKDAASVRADNPIPASCGIYYYEVKVISKGRDGYMGIGLSVQGVNLNRLPGWDTHSYGYHGDDGHSFCSHGQGKPYGPTFSTGDVVGCCVNLIENSCFYTKNGASLGVVFKDLPANLYPTVGLQTPGEIIEANFGQSPFIFKFEEYLKDWKLKVKATIDKFPVQDSKGEFQTILQKIVSTYLVHHGYCATAEAFARSTGQSIDEELVSIKNRQRIQRLVLAGRMGEAIEATKQLYPGLLERSPNLLFILKCRQFIEMVNGTDSQVRASSIHSPKSRAGSARSSPNLSPIHHAMYSSAASQGKAIPSSPLVHHSPNPSTAPQQTTTLPSGLRSSSPVSSHSNTDSINSPHITPAKSHQQIAESSSGQGRSAAGDTLDTIAEEQQRNNVNIAFSRTAASSSLKTSPKNSVSDSKGGVEETDMDTSDTGSRTLSNGVSNGSSSSCMNGSSDGDQHTQDYDMEVESPPHKKQLCGGSQLAIEKMLQFGRELHAMNEQLKREYGPNDTNKSTLKDAFSLLAYSDPWSSPVGFQLDPRQREPICSALNSAILESHGLQKQPPLEVLFGHVVECMKVMSRAGIGSCAFATFKDYL